MVSNRKASQEVLEMVPVVMRVIRREVRRHRQFDLSVPQFRALAFLEFFPGATLSDTAEHVGLTLPGMSRLIDGLVERALIERIVSRGDRRRVELTLTATGKAILADARRLAQEKLAEFLAPLSARENTLVIDAMRILRTVFQPAEKAARAEVHR